LLNLSLVFHIWHSWVPTEVVSIFRCYNLKYCPPSTHTHTHRQKQFAAHVRPEKNTDRCQNDMTKSQAKKRINFVVACIN